MSNNILKKFIKENEGRNIFSIIRELGLKIEYVDYSETDGCCVNVFGKDYILINKNLDKKRTTFTIGHELCHFLLGEKGFSININFAKKDFIEKRADKFSIDLLVPAEILKERVVLYDSNIFQLENYFGVPSEKLKIKLKEVYPNFIF